MYLIPAIAHPNADAAGCGELLRAGRAALAAAPHDATLPIVSLLAPSTGNIGRTGAGGRYAAAPAGPQGTTGEGGTGAGTATLINAPFGAAVPSGLVGATGGTGGLGGSASSSGVHGATVGLQHSPTFGHAGITSSVVPRLATLLCISQVGTKSKLMPTAEPQGSLLFELPLTS